MRHEELLDAWMEAEYAYRSGLQSAGPGAPERKAKALELRKKMSSLLWDLGT